LIKDEQHQKLSKEEKANRKQKEATKILIERAKARKSKGRTESVSIAVHDPDATVQPLKKGGYAPSYKPSIAVNKARIIVAHGLDSSSETAVFEHLLEQSIRTTGGPLGTVLADSAYNCKDVIETAKAKGVEVLIPGGKIQMQSDKQNQCSSTMKIPIHIHVRREKSCSGKMMPNQPTIQQVMYGIKPKTVHNVRFVANVQTAKRVES
jgi:hypothetical protein